MKRKKQIFLGGVANDREKFNEKCYRNFCVYCQHDRSKLLNKIQAFHLLGENNFFQRGNRLNVPGNGRNG